VAIARLEAHDDAQMMTALREGSIDVAVALTEGTVMFKDKHPDIEIVSVYVSSPLGVCGWWCWSHLLGQKLLSVASS
jgi:hypothetical protein